MHISNLYFHEGQAELALRLTEQTGLDRAFFCNSGTEAWEAAMKLARAYSALKRSEGHADGNQIPGDGQQLSRAHDGRGIHHP